MLLITLLCIDGAIDRCWYLVFDGARSVVEVIAASQELQHRPLPQQGDVVPLFRLEGEKKQKLNQIRTIDTIAELNYTSDLW